VDKGTIFGLRDPTTWYDCLCPPWAAFEFIVIVLSRVRSREF